MVSLLLMEFLFLFLFVTFYIFDVFQILLDTMLHARLFTAIILDKSSMAYVGCARKLFVLFLLRRRAASGDAFAKR